MLGWVSARQAHERYMTLASFALYKLSTLRSRCRTPLIHHHSIQSRPVWYAHAPESTTCRLDDYARNFGGVR